MGQGHKPTQFKRPRIHRLHVNHLSVHANKPIEQRIEYYQDLNRSRVNSGGNGFASPLIRPIIQPPIPENQLYKYIHPIFKVLPKRDTPDEQDSKPRPRHFHVQDFYEIPKEKGWATSRSACASLSSAATNLPAGLKQKKPNTSSTQTKHKK